MAPEAIKISKEPLSTNSLEITARKGTKPGKKGVFDGNKMQSATLSQVPPDLRKLAIVIPPNSVVTVKIMMPDASLRTIRFENTDEKDDMKGRIYISSIGKIGVVQNDTVANKVSDEFSPFKNFKTRRKVQELTDAAQELTLVGAGKNGAQMRGSADGILKKTPEVEKEEPVVAADQTPEGKKKDPEVAAAPIPEVDKEKQVAAADLKPKDEEKDPAVTTGQESGAEKDVKKDVPVAAPEQKPEAGN